MTGALTPPEQITAEELRWDSGDAQEVAKMKQWVRVGGWSLILWWAVIGGLVMTYLYSVAGYAYLHDSTQDLALPLGWTASANRHLNRWLSVVVDADEHAARRADDRPFGLTLPEHD